MMDNEKPLKQKTMKKELRNKLVNSILKRVRESGLPDDIAGFLLRTVHFHIPWYFLLFFIFLPLRWAILALIPLLIPFVAFFYFNGCFLTIVEYKLCKNDTNIIDPYILLCKDEVNDKNRYKYTLGVSVLYFSVVAMVFYIRYIYKL